MLRRDKKFCTLRTTLIHWIATRRLRLLAMTMILALLSLRGMK